MPIPWILTYVGLGYIVALSLFGPGIFSALLKDMAAQGKINKLLCDTLLVAQWTASLISIAFVVAFVVRSGKAAGHPDAYRWAMTVVGLATMVAVIWSLAYLNRVLQVERSSRESE